MCLYRASLVGLKPKLRYRVSWERVASHLPEANTEGRWWARPLESAVPVRESAEGSGHVCDARATAPLARPTRVYWMILVGGPDGNTGAVGVPDHPH